MRTDNGKVRGVIVSIYFIMVVLALVLATVFSAFKDLTDNAYKTFAVISVAFVLVFIIFYLVSKYFEYDSDGVKVVVENRGLLLSDRFNYREKRVEFYKKDLLGFKFNDYLVYKSLKLKLRSSNGKSKNCVFNVTLVQKKKRKYIRKSLNKMLRENRKNSDNQ
ncbi:hypothetical protein Q2T40_11075 [Winogradskyella maritima]|uniref:Uncharacterized protein n=1 Tax=Winogradskyella maritima TaxID=1517766 RepID=A0ABV8AIX4_9FLAO|nr:hypothetical protein [Winogradskyella maritima]